MTIHKAGVLSLMVLLFGVAIAGEAERFDGVSIEETYRAFPNDATRSPDKVNATKGRLNAM